MKMPFLFPIIDYRHPASCHCIRAWFLDVVHLHPNIIGRRRTHYWVFTVLGVSFMIGKDD